MSARLLGEMLIATAFATLICFPYFGVLIASVAAIGAGLILLGKSDMRYTPPDENGTRNVRNAGNVTITELYSVLSDIDTPLGKPILSRSKNVSYEITYISDCQNDVRIYKAGRGKSIIIEQNSIPGLIKANLEKRRPSIYTDDAETADTALCRSIVSEDYTDCLYEMIRAYVYSHKRPKGFPGYCGSIKLYRVKRTEETNGIFEVSDMTGRTVYKLDSNARAGLFSALPERSDITGNKSACAKHHRSNRDKYDVKLSGKHYGTLTRLRFTGFSEYTMDTRDGHYRLFKPDKSKKGRYRLRHNGCFAAVITKMNNGKGQYICLEKSKYLPIAIVLSAVIKDS